MLEVLRVRVAFADTDAMGVAWHGNYLRWFEMARTEMMRPTELPYPALVGRGIHLPVIEALVRYRQPARYDDLLIVHAGPVRARNQVVLNLEILVQELGGQAVVGHDAAHARGGDEDEFGALLGVETVDGGGIEQVEFGLAATDQLVKTLALEFAPDGTAHQPRVSGDINSSVSRNLHCADK